MKSLFATQVSFRGPDRNVPEQELNLIQFATSQMAEPGAGAPQVMRGEPFYPCPTCRISNNFPEHFLGHAVTPDLAGLVDGLEDPILPDSARLRPGIDCRFDPDRDWHRADVPSLSDQVRYDSSAPPVVESIPDSSSVVRRAGDRIR